MATGDTYSRLVQISKIVLPLAAFAIISTVFLLSRGVNPENAVQFAHVDVESIAREQRLTNPRFATVGTDGAAIELSATEARPDPDNGRRVEATDIIGTIATPGGLMIGLRSGSALVDLGAQTVGLTDDVRVTSTLGYSITAKDLLARLDRAEFWTDAPVSVETPFGNLDAGNMMLTRKGEDYRLVFNNKVKLVYHP